MQWDIEEQSPCLTGFQLKIISGENEATAVVVRENVRQFKLAAPIINKKGMKIIFFEFWHYYHQGWDDSILANVGRSESVPI